MHPITATLDYNSSAQSKQQNRIAQQILLFGLIFQQASIITKVNACTGTQKAVLMSVKKKQIRQETEQHRDSKI
jgi:hypothetical protein